VEDLKLMMQVLAANGQNHLPELPTTDFDQGESWDGQPLQIGYSEHINGVTIDQEYLEIFQKFLAKVKVTSKGLTKDHPEYNEKEAYLKYNTLLGFEMGVNNPRFPLMAVGLYTFLRLKYRDHWWAKGMARGMNMSNAGYARTIDYKDRFSEIYDEFLTRYDLWITPVCPIEAYKHQKAGKPFTINGKKVGYTEAMGKYAFTTAFSGHPIAVIPIGKKKNGMPVGVQLHARKWSDKRLLEIAQHLEALTDGYEVPGMVKEK